VVWPITRPKAQAWLQAADASAILVRLARRRQCGL
jgi:hypothetical protein